MMLCCFNSSLVFSLILCHIFMSHSCNSGNPLMYFSTVTMWSHSQKYSNNLKTDVSLGASLNCKTSPCHLLLSVNCFFCQYQMVGGPWAWHQSGHHRYLWHSYIGLFILRRRLRVWGQKRLRGCLTSSIFLCQSGFPSVSNTTRTSCSQNGISLSTRHFLSKPPPLSCLPPILLSVEWPPWPGGSRWSQVHTIGMIIVTVLFFSLSAGKHSYVAYFTESLPSPVSWESKSQRFFNIWDFITTLLTWEV